MSSVCSTCKFNGGCIDDVIKVFRIEDLRGFPGNAIFCKAHANELKTREFVVTMPREKCKFWEVCNNGFSRETT